MGSLGRTLFAFVLLHSVLQGQIHLLFQVSLDFLLLHSSPLERKGHLFWVLVLEGLVGLHRIFQLQLFSITSWGIGIYEEYIMRNAGLEEAQAGIKPAGRK